MASFYSLYRHGFARTAVGVPHVRVADPQFNAERMIALAQKAHENHAALILFPELALSAYTCDDLFHQDALLDAVEEAATRIVEASRDLTPLLLIGLPLRIENRLFNIAAVIHKGRVLGLIPKTYLPNYREFYEKRQFASASEALTNAVTFAGQENVPFGTDVVFEARDLPGFSLFIETCEDMWTPVPPSTWGALSGATLLANLSASNITIGKADYRRTLCAAQSGRCASAYLYSGAGPGESTNDLAWDGHALIYENGELLAESERFSPNEQIIWADVDLERLLQERMRLTSWGDTVRDWKDKLQTIRRVGFDLGVPKARRPARAPNRAVSLCAEQCQIARRTLLRSVQHSSPRLDETLAGDRHTKNRHRCVRRFGFHPRLNCRRANDGYAETAAHEYFGLHDAGLCNQRPHPAKRARLNECAGRDGPRD